MKSFMFFESLSSILGRTKSNIWPAISSYEHKNGWPLWATLEHMFSNFTNLQTTRGNSPVISLPFKCREILLYLLESRNHVVTNHRTMSSQTTTSNHSLMEMISKLCCMSGWLGSIRDLWDESTFSWSIWIHKPFFVNQFRKPAKQNTLCLGININYK